VGGGLRRLRLRLRVGKERYLDEDFLEARIHAFLVQLVAVERHALDEFLHRALRLERKERQAERDVAPLARVLRKPEALAELFDDALCLFFLFFRACRACQWSVGGKGRDEQHGGPSLTFSMNVKM
jgi:hypothetical protein